MGSALAFLRRSTSNPSATLGRVAAEKIALAQESAAKVAVAAEPVAREINDTEKSYSLMDPDGLQGYVSPRGVNARFEVWKKTWDNTLKRNIRSITVINEMAGVEESHFYRFLVTNISMPQRERFSIVRTFGADPNFLMTFGQEPRIWNISGVLPRLGPEGGTRDWMTTFMHFYRNRLRADRMVRENEEAVFIAGKLIMEGYVLSLDINMDAQNSDAAVSFSMSFYAQSYRFLTSYDGDKAGFQTLYDGDADNGGSGFRWQRSLPSLREFGQVAQPISTAPLVTPRVPIVERLPPAPRPPPPGPPPSAPPPRP